MSTTDDLAFVLAAKNRALDTIARIAAPGSRTLDDFIRDMRMIRDIARESVAECEEMSPCLSGIATEAPCSPDDTMKRCTICGFIVDTKFKAEL